VYGYIALYASLKLEHVPLPENVGVMLSALCVGLLTWRALYLVYMAGR
jgi:hypothetical protein